MCLDDSISVVKNKDLQSCQKSLSQLDLVTVDLYLIQLHQDCREQANFLKLSDKANSSLDSKSN